MTSTKLLPFADRLGADRVGAWRQLATVVLAVCALAWQPSAVSGQPLGTATAHLLLAATAESLPQLRLRGPLPPVSERLIWMEVTSLESDAPSTRYLFREDARTVPILGVAEGAVIVCVGIEMRSVTCREAYVELGHSRFDRALGVDPITGVPGVIGRAGAESDALGQPVAQIPVDELVIEIERGVPISGRFRQGGEPVVGARVSVIPDGLDTRRPFVMPLGIGVPPPAPVVQPEGARPAQVAPPAPAPTATAMAANPGDTTGDGVAETPAADPRPAIRRAAGRLEDLTREVVTNSDGGFRLPELAPGIYRLETLLPSGRLHHSDVFVALSPSPAFATLDLGTIVVPDGLRLDVQVIDDTGAPISGAAVSARQGTRIVDATLFQTRTDPEGWARLSGFVAELPMHLRCDADGHAAQVTDHDLLPVETTCVLVRQARITGQVIGPSGEVPAGTRLTLLRLASDDEGDANDTGSDDEDSPGGGQDGRETVARQHATSITGTFDLRQLDPGSYRLELAAPGFAPESQSVSVAAGERLDLGIIFLGAAPSLEGIVVDARDDTALAGVSVSVLRPAGGGSDVTDDNGAFSVTNAGADTELVIEARHPEYAVTRHTIPPRQDSLGAEDRARAEERALEEPLRISLRRGGRVLVVVWDASTGRTCRGCTVRIEPGGFELSTNGDGEALSDLLIPGRYRVELSRITHLGSTVVEEPEAAVRYTRVREAGIAPVWFGDRTQPVRVRFRPLPDPRWILIGRSKGRAQRVEPEADGTFTLEQEVGETVGLYLQGWDEAASATVEVRQGQLLPSEGPREVVLDLPTGTLRGRLRSGDGGAAGVRVRLRGLHDGARAALLSTDPEGHFLVPHLPPGIYALEVGERPLKFVRIGTGERVDLGSWDLVPGTF